MAIRSIRTRLTIWYTGILALTFLILGTAAYALVSYTLHKDNDSALRSVAEVLAGRSLADNRFPPDVDAVFRRFFGLMPMAPYFEWLDPRGNSSRRFEEPGGAPPLTDVARHNAMKGLATFETIKGVEPYPTRVLTWPVIDSGRVIGVVRVGMSQMNLQKTLSDFLLIMTALFPLALALAGGGGWFLAHRALLPVDRMTRTAREIKAGKLDARIEKTGANDELDRLADTLNEMLDRLQSAFTEMRQFTADASHELQTPLTILRGEIEVALRARRSPEEYTAVLKSCLEEIQRISLLVEGLLLLARSDAGVLKMDRSPVDLIVVAEEVLNQLRPLAAEKAVTLGLGRIEPLEIVGDFTHLRRLLVNLVDNAIKYTLPHGTVTVSVERREPWAALTVKDTGIGIPPEEKEKIFQRHYRSAEARSSEQGGSGLGLSLVKSIVEAHGGRIELESTVNQGSTFTLLLPLSEQTALKNSNLHLIFF
ncbi:MAG: putative sensor histidine kinase TcrY [Syntrophorhabdaceae bacterium PtaU1.Bin034]|nr:MAG: putative sensor histidine kinase TcrY [Syntrophorhabdaceae bacterium PtaU1.Bin034]